MENNERYQDLFVFVVPSMLRVVVKLLEQSSPSINRSDRA